MSFFAAKSIPNVHFLFSAEKKGFWEKCFLSFEFVGEQQVVFTFSLECPMAGEQIQYFLRLEVRNDHIYVAKTTLAPETRRSAKLEDY